MYALSTNQQMDPSICYCYGLHLTQTNERKPYKSAESHSNWDPRCFPSEAPTNTHDSRLQSFYFNGDEGANMIVCVYQKGIALGCLRRKRCSERRAIGVPNRMPRSTTSRQLRWWSSSRPLVKLPSLPQLCSPDRQSSNLLCSSSRSSALVQKEDTQTGF